MRVLIACEFSGIAREAFRKKGHDAWSCDLLPTEIPGQHIQGDVLVHLYEVGVGYYDFIIHHSPCTYHANSGARWLWNSDGSKNYDRWKAMYESVEFFNSFSKFADKVVGENPIPHKYARDRIGKYDQIIQPTQFGHTTRKATCLWLQKVKPLLPTKIISKEEWTFDIHRMAPGPNRQKDRSRTFQGIADAMAEQWG